MTSRAENKKIQAREQITNHLLDVLASGVEWNGTLWHCDHVFQAQLTAFVSAFSSGLLPPAYLVTIRARDNTMHALSLDQLKQLAMSIMGHVQAAYAASWAAKDAL